MKLNLLFLLTIIFIVNTSFSQNDKEIILETLKFFDNRFYLHLDEMNEPIIVKYNDENYLLFEYTNKKFIKIDDVKFELILKSKNEENYFFNLKLSTEYRGSFQIEFKDNKLTVYNLNFLKIEK
jgi:hypothetical protein